MVFVRIKDTGRCFFFHKWFYAEQGTVGRGAGSENCISVLQAAKDLLFLQTKAVNQRGHVRNDAEISDVD